MAPCVRSWQSIWQICQCLIPNTTRWKGIAQREIQISKTNAYLWVPFRQHVYVCVLRILSSVSRQLLCSILKHSMRDKLKCLLPTQYGQSVSPSENTPSHPQGHICSCRRVEVYIKEQITSVNQNNDFSHTCMLWGLTLESGIRESPNTDNARTRFWEETDG